MKRFLRGLAVGLLLLPIGASAARAASTPLTCEALPSLINAYFQNHVVFHQLDDEVKRRAIDTYLKRLDPSRALYLASEAQAIEASLGDVFDQVRRGNCSELLALHERTNRRYRDMEAFARKVVGREDYQIDPAVKLVIDPDKRGWPRTDQERDKLYTALIHFQMSNYVSSGTPLAEAKTLLIHRYELASKQAAEQRVDEVYAGFLDAFANALDPHSNYLSADDVEEFQIGMGLTLEGVGLALSSRDGYAVVEEVIPGGAADHSKMIKPKDKIIAVAQESGDPVNVIDLQLRDVVRMIRGKKGTPVRLTILRQGEGTERFTVTLVRAKIDLEQQAAKLHFENRTVDGKQLKLAVLELPSFYGDRDSSKRQSDDDVKRLLKEVNRQKVDGLVLDLSRNGGGLLDDAVSISGLFLRSGGIVAVKNPSSEPQILSDPDEEVRYSGPLVVLTSRVTASASEILAGAMKDYHRAIIVGDDHTFGKGTVQAVMPLREGLGALKVTTSLFFRPGGESTQLKGVAADIVLPSVFATDDIGEKSQPYPLPAQRISPFVSREANAADGPEQWRAVTPDLLSKLAEQSKLRVQSSAAFQEIDKERAEAERNRGVIDLSEMLKQREDEKKRESDDTDPEKKKDSPQVGEALSILADYVVLTGGGRPATATAATTATP